MQGNSRLQADEVQLHQKEAQDNRSRYVPLMRSVMSITTKPGDPQRAERLGESEHQRYQVWEGDYQMVGRQGRGKADLINNVAKTAIPFWITVALPPVSGF